MSVEIWTTHLAKHRKLGEDGIHLVDITRQFGDSVFSPSWNILNSYKRGEISWLEYHKMYTEEMRESYVSNTQEWEKYLHIPKIALGCVCSKNDNCHRKILRNIFIQIYLNKGILYIERGEYE